MTHPNFLRLFFLVLLSTQFTGCAETALVMTTVIVEDTVDKALAPVTAPLDDALADILLPQSDERDRRINARRTSRFAAEYGVEIDLIRIGQTMRSEIHETFGPPVSVLPPQQKFDFYAAVNDDTDSDSYNGKWYLVPSKLSVKEISYRVAVIEYDGNSVVKRFEMVNQEFGSYYDIDRHYHKGCLKTGTCFLTDFSSELDVSGIVGVPMMVSEDAIEKGSTVFNRLDSNFCHVKIYVVSIKHSALYGQFKVNKVFLPFLADTHGVYIYLPVEPGETRINLMAMRIGQSTNEVYFDEKTSINIDNIIISKPGLQFECKAGETRYVEANYVPSPENRIELHLVDLEIGKNELKWRNRLLITARESSAYGFFGEAKEIAKLNAELAKQKDRDPIEIFGVYASFVKSNKGRKSKPVVFLARSGNEIQGKFIPDNGDRITGTLQNNKIRFHWMRATGAYDRVGTWEIKDAEKTRLEGTWEDEGNTNGTWKLSKTGVGKTENIDGLTFSVSKAVNVTLAGTYRSKITGSHRESDALVVEQVGNKITGISANKEWEIEGVIEGDTIKFAWYGPSNSGKGKFTIDSRGNLIGVYTGQWGSGKWILTKSQ